MTGRQLWFDPIFGASGDMLLGALVGLGAPLDGIVDGLKTLPVDGWTLTSSTVQRASLSATRVDVTTHEVHHHRTWSSIDAMLADAPLSPNVVKGARATFRALGQVEADIHGIPIDEVHFHEVGAVDAIIDIVGTWLALDSLEIDTVGCGPIGLGRGTVAAAHGLLPVPAPATSALLQDTTVTGVDVPFETVTPTGAALLTTLSDSHGSIPTGVLRAVARGAGGRDPDGHPNVLSAYLVETAAGSTTGETTGGPMVGPAVILQTNLDDVTGETVAHTISRCLELGASDAWAHPIVMKKGRPGVELNILAAPEVVERLRRTVFAETASLGLRTSTVTKYAQPREFHTVVVDGHSVRIKVGPHGAKPEYDDLAAAARALDRPLAELADRAIRLHHEARGRPFRA